MVKLQGTNGTKAMLFLKKCIDADMPMGYHTFGEIIQY
jgi:hypothetical protein